MLRRRLASGRSSKSSTGVRRFVWFVGFVLAPLALAVVFAQDAPKRRNAIIFVADGLRHGSVNPMRPYIRTGALRSNPRASSSHRRSTAVADSSWTGAARITEFVQRRPLDGAPVTERLSSALCSVLSRERLQ